MKKLIIIFLTITSIVCAQEIILRSKSGSLVPKKETQTTLPVIDDTVKEKEYFTPFLVVNILSTKPSGNESLNANEEGYVTLSVKNIGKLPAENCRVQLVQEVKNPNITVSGIPTIERLESGEEIQFKILIKASEEIKTGKESFTLKILEKRNFNLYPERIIIIPTREYQPPILEIVGYDIEDQTRDTKIELFEKVDITIRVQNLGENPSENTKAIVRLGKNVICLDSMQIDNSSQLEYNIGQLMPGESTDIKTIIGTNALAKEVKLDIKVTEKTGKYSAERTITLPLNVVQKKSEEYIIAEGEDQKTFSPEVLNKTLDLAEGIPQASERKVYAVAVIIGNKDYLKAPSVDYALNDAAIMKNYVMQTFGYSEENIIYLRNAQQSDLTTIFGNEQIYRGKLFDLAKKGLSEIFIYYSGHGAPDPESKQGYIVPVDCDPNRVALNGYSIKTLYNNLDKIAVEKDLKQITVVLDACFSGSSEGGSLLSNISPIYIGIEKQGLTFSNSALFTSATGDQVSTWYKEKKQSLFTYYFLKGLKGEADLNKDDIITTEELYQFTADEVNGVPDWSRRLNGRTQTPTFIGNNFELFK